MKKFNIEHVGLMVSQPVAMANWYQEVLGFNIQIAGEDGEKGAAFITDAANRVMLEFGKVPGVSPLSTRTDYHLQLHIAVHSDDPDEDMKYLVSQGATFIERCPVTRPGENLIVLYDPWGNCLQLVKRAKP
jgi:catechol 2,3-dioxygenase-like lactoylglutathione lyase family enzyme